MPGKRIVLLEMTTEDAEDFVRKVAEYSKVCAVAPPPEDEEHFTHPYPAVSATIEAVVARPTVWCKCEVVTESKYQRRRRLKTGAAKREQGWSRGTKLGWWICASCSKPSRAAVLHWVSSMLVGANDLLPVILGTGKPIPPSLRWQRDGGVPNDAADADHFTRGVVDAMDGVPSRRSQQRLRKPRRSDVDREARNG